MSLGAYQQTQKTTESPRDSEYRLFGQVTRALMEAKDVDRLDSKKMEALDWNRRMWLALSNDCAGKDNGLPEKLRAQIISIGLWVSKYSSDIMRGNGDIDDLIDINRTIMEGLKLQAGH
jgi:flagellar biosynthesis activator protein FlaF